MKRKIEAALPGAARTERQHKQIDGKRQILFGSVRTDAKKRILALRAYFDAQERFFRTCIAIFNARCAKYQEAGV